MPETLWKSAVEQLKHAHESAMVLRVRRAQSAGESVLLVRDVIHVNESDYEERSSTRLRLPSRAWFPILGQAAAAADGALFVHTHPGGSALPSRYDLTVDEELVPPFQLRTGQPFYGSLILGGSTDAPTFTGAVIDASGHRESITLIRVVGRRVWVKQAERDSTNGPTTEGTDDAPLHDRQVRAFGVAGQALIGALHVGIVGAGGTGSSVAEQLLRLGVGKITILDDDALTVSNLSRVHEAGLEDVAESKVSVVARTAARLGRSNVDAHEMALLTPHSLELLKTCDVLFGCTDDQRGRAILNRLAYYYLAPLIDMGVLISSVESQLTGIDGRVSFVSPGTACLLCRGRLDPAAIRNESLTPQERAALVAEGYAPELGDPDPSVVTYTTLVASLAVHALLGRLFGYAPVDGTELLFRGLQDQLRPNHVLPNPQHFCADTTTWGRGDTTPPLDQTWA
ncbi:MAG: hypothetical protein JWM02_3122 [Frankiales bacterium]|nr:hypothetical protein [Frankiales bacterium]